MHTTRAEIYRAHIEATAFGARAIIERLREYGVPVDKVVCAGGIAEKNALLMQVYADVFNCTMQVAGSSQACALGSAVSAAVLADVHPDFATAQKAMTRLKDIRYEPKPENVSAYDELYALYRQLHDAFGGVDRAADLSGIVPALIDLKERAMAFSQRTPQPTNCPRRFDITPLFSVSMKIPPFEIWYVTGSQHLYGEAALRQVAANSQKIVAELNATSRLPLPLVCKPIVTRPEEARATSTRLATSSGRSTMPATPRWRRSAPSTRSFTPRPPRPAQGRQAARRPARRRTHRTRPALVPRIRRVQPLHRHLRGLARTQATSRHRCATPDGRQLRLRGRGRLEDGRARARDESHRRQPGLAPTVWLSDPDNRAARTQIGRPVIKVQTIHSAKGLQYRAVVLLWAGDLSVRPAEPEATAAERRLFYMGLTRAVDYSAICHSNVAASFVTEARRTVSVEALPTAPLVWQMPPLSKGLQPEFCTFLECANQPA